MEKFTFFWRVDEEPYGCFSQWFWCKFFHNDIEYNCAEQWMMASKARLFNDQETLAKIMATDDPRTQKKLGRAVKNFDEAEWNKVAKTCVHFGNRYKFEQNPKLKEILLATAGTTLVEASPYDAIWGIGLTADDPRALTRETWLGTNWLGEVLTNLREHLKK